MMGRFWFSGLTVAGVTRNTRTPSIAGPPRSKTRYRAALIHLPHHLADLVEDLADLVLRDDQRRRERDGVAGDAEEEAVLLEALLHRVVGALADSVRL